MIKSMTGYGKAELPINEARFDLEIKSVNHRYCEISMPNIPPGLNYLESKIKKMIAARFVRGHFYISFHIVPLSKEADSSGFFINFDLAERCYHTLANLKKKLQLAENISLSHLLEFRDTFIQKAPFLDLKSVEENIEVLLEEAMSGLERMRKEEGAALAENMVYHLGLLKSKIKEIEESREPVIQNYQKRLQRKIGELKGTIEIDPQRIAHEVVLFSDRMDISEETTRLRSHLEQFCAMVGGDGPAGRTLDFLLQEMNREMNTIVSKSGGVPATVFIKQELEILREQVQNIE
ncbi:MAG: YicC/YloC family endoribonuclease [Nitrospiria bacterium]